VKKQRYTYDARLHAGRQSVYDGDTVRLDVDLGYSCWKFNEPHRLYGINAPEMRRPEKERGIISRDWLRDQLEDKEIFIETLEKGKYGRYLAILWVDGVNINRKMIELGFAEQNFYGGEPPDSWYF
jgi:micrococcal nuclease